jgi:hypothetical protein
MLFVLAAGHVSGTTTVQGQLARAHMKATACAQLPELAVTTLDDASHSD